jgi:hypothetical protein
MEQNEILKGNQLIAEFMGGKIAYFSVTNLPHYRNLPYGRTITFSELKYHSSWYWLMPAVEKIKDIDNEADIEMAKMLEFFKDDEECNIFHTSIFCHLKEVWNRTVVFIKWYNAKCQTVS